LHGSRKLFGTFYENSKVMPPGWNDDDQFGDGCQNKVWDPESHKENQFWELMVCEELHPSLKILTLKNEAYWRFKYW